NNSFDLQLARGILSGETKSVGQLTAPDGNARSIRDDVRRQENLQAVNARIGKDHALLIATNRYNDAHFKPLDNPVPDAQVIAKDLQTLYGFDVKVVENPTLQELLSVLRDYAKRQYGEDDQLFIFFAGHGTYDEVY